MKDNLTYLFNRCLHIHYRTVEEDGTFATEQRGDTLYIYFDMTGSKMDWRTNFSFFVKPYKHMLITWRCHGGFLKVWKAIQPYLTNLINNLEFRRIVIVGYSHGAALATLCHEYVWYCRPDLREGDGITGYGFGCPRVYWGRMKKELAVRWKNFHPVRNLTDLVTHVPFRFMGFRHVNKVLQLPNVGLYRKYTPLKCINAHYPKNYIHSIKEYDEDSSKQ